MCRGCFVKHFLVVRFLSLWVCVLPGLLLYDLVNRRGDGGCMLANRSSQPLSVSSHPPPVPAGHCRLTELTVGCSARPHPPKKFQLGNASPHKGHGTASPAALHGTQSAVVKPIQSDPTQPTIRIVAVGRKVRPAGASSGVDAGGRRLRVVLRVHRDREVLGYSWFSAGVEKDRRFEGLCWDGATIVRVPTAMVQDLMGG